MLSNNNNDEMLNLGELVALIKFDNPFEPTTINLITTFEILTALVHLSQSHISDITTKITQTYLYFGHLRVPNLEKTNVRQIPTNAFVPGQLKKLIFITKQLVSLKNVTSKDRHKFEEILFGKVTLPA
jgi:hypothetical protein